MLPPRAQKRNRPPFSKTACINSATTAPGSVSVFSSRGFNENPPPHQFTDKTEHVLNDLFPFKFF